MSEERRGATTPRDAAAEHRLNRLLALIMEIATEAVGFDGATVTVRDGTDLGTVAATRPDLMLLDAAQYTDEEGPCLTAIAQQEPIHWDADDGERHWRAFQEAAAGLGIATSLSFPLPVDEPSEIAASLNLYGSKRDELVAEQMELAAQCALQLGIVLQMINTTRSTAEMARRAADAIRSRATIEQAKGVLSIQQGVSVSEASDLLAEMASRDQATLTEVAGRIMQGGATNEPPS